MHNKTLHKFMLSLSNVMTFPLRKEPLLFAALCGVSLLTILSTWYCGSRGIGTIIANLALTYLITAVMSGLSSLNNLSSLKGNPSELSNPSNLSNSLNPLNLSNSLIRILIIAYSMLTALLLFFGALFIKTPSAMNTLMLILQTNTQETSDFFTYYVHFKEVALTVLAITITVVASFLVYRLCIKCQQKNVFSCFCLNSISLVCLLCVLALIKLPTNVLQTTPQLEFYFTNLDLVLNHHDLRDYVQNPQLQETKNIHPQNVILILGESHCRDHSSLLGYDKETNPLLQKLVDSHNLVAFDSITSPGAYTGQCILQIMSTYSEEGLNGFSSSNSSKGKPLNTSNSSNSSNWWEAQTVPTTMRAAGYKTIWLTNQKDGATRDAIADSYAQLCDVFKRTPNKNAYDEALFPLMKQQFPQNSLDSRDSCSNHNFIVFHLMGSHEDYSQRYPSRFAHFKPSDYSNFPKHQRANRAAYDNSVLYNDYIINTIINHFSQESTIVIYFPDHAIDLYVSDPNYAAHASDNPLSQQTARQIPMYIYLSDKYKQQAPEAYNKLYNQRHKQLNTGNFIYTLLSLIGYQFKQ